MRPSFKKCLTVVDPGGAEVVNTCAPNQKSVARAFLKIYNNILYQLARSVKFHPDTSEASLLVHLDQVQTQTPLVQP